MESSILISADFQCVLFCIFKSTLLVVLFNKCYDTSCCVIEGVLCLSHPRHRSRTYLQAKIGSYLYEASNRKENCPLYLTFFSVTNFAGNDSLNINFSTDRELSFPQFDPNYMSFKQVFCTTSEALFHSKIPSLSGVLYMQLGKR